MPLGFWPCGRGAPAGLPDCAAAYRAAPVASNSSKAPSTTCSIRALSSLRHRFAGIGESTGSILVPAQFGPFVIITSSVNLLVAKAPCVQSRIEPAVNGVFRLFQITPARARAEGVQYT